MKVKNIKDNIYKLIPLILIIGFVPLIVQLKMYPIEDNIFNFWKGETTNADFFSYYKSRALIIITLVAVGIFIYDYVKKNVQIAKSKIYIPLVIYWIFVFISTISSTYKDVVLWGFIERHEGFIVITCYMLLMFICINYIRSEKGFKGIIYTLIISAVIISIIGIFQYVGKDIFQEDWGKKLILPSEYDKLADNITFNHGKNTIYSTLYHYNYVGSYIAMVFPLTLTLALLVKNKISKTIFLCCSALFAFVWIGSNSRAGVVGGVVALTALVIFLRKKIFEKWKLSLLALMVVSIVIVGANSLSDGAVFNRVKSILTNLTKTEEGFVDAKIEGKTFTISDGDKTLTMGYDGEGLYFLDKDGKNLEVELIDSVVRFNDERFSSYEIIAAMTNTNDGDKLSIKLSNGTISIQLLAIGDTFYVIDGTGRANPIEEAESIGFKGKERMGSARGYIWSRSIPMLKDTLFVGHGPDTFAIYFPQNDYLGKLNAYGTTNMIVDKPHNMYLQAGINTGVISMIAMMAMFIMYIISSFKVLFKNDFNDFYSVVALGVFVAVIGYLGAGLFNDSIVSVAPVFWMLFGIGVSVNEKIKA